MITNNLVNNYSIDLMNECLYRKQNNPENIYMPFNRKNISRLRKKYFRLFEIFKIQMASYYYIPLHTKFQLTMPICSGGTAYTDTNVDRRTDGLHFIF